MDDDVTGQQLAARIRAGHRRSRARRQTVLVAVLLTAIAAGTVLALSAQARSTPADGTASDPAIAAPRNSTADYGFALTAATADPAAPPADANAGPDAADPDAADPAGTQRVAVYEDFLCPSCRSFHEQTGPFLAAEVAAGRVTLVYHPFAFLTRATTDEYTQRAANAAACVGDVAGAAGYAAMHDRLMQHQPAEGGAGLPDATLIAYGKQAGAGDISRCVRDRTFTPWIEAALAAGREAGVTETPTVLVNGTRVVRTVDGAPVVPGEPEITAALGRGA